MTQTEESFLKKLYGTSPRLLKRGRLNELVRVYQDLEKTLKGLKASADHLPDSSLTHINVGKLISQLSRSKKKLERKINNTLLLEKQHLKKRIKTMASNLATR